MCITNEPELGGASSFPFARLPDAARDNDWEVVWELLFELGASVIDLCDDTGSNILHWAISHKKTRFIRVSESASRVLWCCGQLRGGV